jgi:hypothetical protein
VGLLHLPEVHKPTVEAVEARGGSMLTNRLSSGCRRETWRECLVLLVTALEALGLVITRTEVEEAAVAPEATQEGRGAATADALGDT